MAVNTLVLHQRYVRGRAWDMSGNRNHGVVSHVTPGAGPLEGSLSFSTQHSRIDTPPSQSLGEMGAFRVSVSAAWAPVRDHRGHGPHAQPHQFHIQPVTIVEGDGSFVMTIEDDPDSDDGSDILVKAWILDAGGAWRGVTHRVGPGSIGPSTGGWHRFDMGHDGIATCWLALDGRVVEHVGGVPGPVRPLGPRGLTIGHPTSDEIGRTFHGHMAEAWLWAERPDPPTNHCCGDRDARTDAEMLLRAKGVDLDRARSIRRGMTDVVADWRRRFPEPAGQSLDATCAALHHSFEQQRWPDFGQLASQVLATSQAHVDPQTIEGLATRMADTIGTDIVADVSLFRSLFAGFFCDVPPPNDSGGGKGGGGKGEDGARPWGADATLPEPDLAYEPPPDPESEQA